MAQAGVIRMNGRSTGCKSVCVKSHQVANLRHRPPKQVQSSAFGGVLRASPHESRKVLKPQVVACMPGREDSASLVAGAVADVESIPSFEADVALTQPLDPRPDLVRGRLDNGFEYVIVPNKSPPRRFEAHLQMHVGSVDEREDEQGISHIVEHITFLGSRKREMLIGTGARSNAYTDFHHTVFHVHSPMENTQTGAPMLGQVIEALTEVAFQPEFLRMRIEKERKAVLAEAQMMNTIEYRIDCQLLRYLHRENAIGYRFPIGLVDQIKAWKKEQMYDYWKRWYFPGNATLYIVGDLQTPEEIQKCKALIQESFGKIPPGLNPEDGSLRLRHPVRPPVVHVHGCGPLREDEATPMEVSTFRHPLVSNFNLSIFAKLPVHPMDTLRHVKEVLVHRILVSVYQRRIGRSYNEGDHSFHSIELDISDSGREGCSVCTLTVTSEPKDWAGAVRVAIREGKRMQQYGVTQGELERYLEALLNDGSQLAAACDSQAHAEVLDFVMECITNKQTVNDNVQSFQTMLEVAKYITLEEVNAMARSYLSFIASYGNEAEALADYAENPHLYYEPGPVRPTCIVACIPSFVDASGESLGGMSAPRKAAMSTMGHIDGSHINVDDVVQPGEELEESHLPPPGSVVFDWKESDLQAVLSDTYEVEPLEDVAVPDTFVTDEYIEERMERLKPHFVPLPNREEQGAFPPPEATTGVVQRRLSNGVALNYKVSKNDPGSASLRLCASGGRAFEVTFGAGPAGVGAVQVGLRCISEAGTIADFKREEVEMFCLSRLINCMMDTDAENSFIDMHFTSNSAGISAVFQLLHLMAERPLWDEKAFNRARLGCESAFRAVPKSLERNSYDRILQMVFGNDRRFREPNIEELSALTLDGVREVTERLMRPDNFEVSIVGDFDPQELETTFLRLMGTIEPRPGPWPLPMTPITFNNPPVAERHQVWHLQDSDERANGHIAGIAFRRWGALDSSGPVQALTGPVQPPPVVFAGSATEMALAQALRRNHPLFATTVLLMLLEVINGRLFITVRDQLNLTYDVAFELNQFDRLNNAWFCVSVTATPAKIAEATQASLQVLRDLKISKITQSELERARSTLLTRHESEMKDNAYMLNLITHLQAPDVPLKTVECLRDLSTMMRAITLSDVNDAYAHFGLDDDEIFTVMGTSGPKEPDVPPKLRMQADGSAQSFAASRGQGPQATDLLMAALAEGLKQQLKLMGGPRTDNTNQA